MDFLVIGTGLSSNFIFLCMNAAENKTFINLILWFKTKLHNYCTVYIHWTVQFKLIILSCMTDIFFLLSPCSNKHYLCISAPAMPLPPLEPMPGPGHYNVVDYEGPPKHYMSSSAFVSTTSRWTGGVLGEEDSPGPGMLHNRLQ